MVTTQKTQEVLWPWEHIPLNAPIRTHSSRKNGAHLYAVAAVVGHSDRQDLLDDRIQLGQEDLCSYLQRREGEGRSALLRPARPLSLVQPMWSDGGISYEGAEQLIKCVTLLVLNCCCQKGVVIHLDCHGWEKLKPIKMFKGSKGSVISCICA